MLDVETVSGTVRGAQLAEVLAFKGIPYAAPVEGINRWLPPQRRAPWSGTLDATSYGAICPQQPPVGMSRLLLGAAAFEYMKLSVLSAPQGSDCLNLNVWTTALGREHALPVMVWIHGGGLAVGAASASATDGASLARHGVVVVTLNYRLAAMGLLAADGLFPGEVGVGNRAFMDQVAALEWVRDNIAAFGGDPGNVTIFGQSAGGTGVAALLVSPRSAGLFRRAIMQSGPINMMPIEDHLAFTRAVLKELEVGVGDVQAMADLPNKKIVGTLMQRMLFRRGSPFGNMSATKLPFAGAYGTAFMPRDVLDALARGASGSVDLLIGSNRDDGLVPAVAVPGPKAIMTRLFNYMIAGMVGATREQRKEVLARYRRLMPDASGYRVQAQIQTDALYRMRSIRAAELHAGQPGGRTYMYQFNWDSPVFEGVLGAIHGLDVPFVFDNLAQGEGVVGDVAQAQPLATAMCEAWTSFARTGVPTSRLLPEWPRYEVGGRKTMIFDRQCRVDGDPDGDMRRIWDGHAGFGNRDETR